MTELEHDLLNIHIARMEEEVKFLKRLEEMQGPERHLVGESRSARKQGGVEEVKPGRRDVGEIGGATELRRHLTRKIEEARGKWKHAESRGAVLDAYAWMAVNDALVQLRADFERMAEKRSDLSNAEPIRAGVDSEIN